MKRFFRNLIIAVVILLVSFFMSLLLHSVFNMNSLIPSFFVLSVFLISIITKDYILGVISAFVSVISVNYAFTFPFFEFNFTLPENLVSAIIMIVVTTLTSTLAIKIKNQEVVKAQADREKTRADLLRAVSHDLRTPLTVIYGASSTMTENYENLSDEQKFEMLNGIKDDSQWLIRMVENLLSVTRIDNSNVKLLKSSVVLEELIDCVLAKFSKRYPEQNVNIKMPDEFVTILADPILIEQVLINLLENAVCHAEGMTELKLNTYVEDKKAVFEVIDDGCGISKEKLKYIFDGSIISDNLSVENSKRGMGIGLGVCSTIIKAHGGEIKAYNNKKGKGMTFRFTLDVEENENE